MTTSPRPVWIGLFVALGLALAGAGPAGATTVFMATVDCSSNGDGRLFVNVHTTSYRMGEVRGFLVPLTPARAATWCALKSIDR